MKRVFFVFIANLLLLAIAGCGKKEKSAQDEIIEAIEGEYAGYFSYQEAFSADDALFRTQSLTIDSVCWRYGARSVSRTLDISVNGDTAIVTVSTTVMATAYFRICSDSDSVPIMYSRPVTFDGTRRARFVHIDDRWRLNAITPVVLSTNPVTAQIDSFVAVNITSGDTFRIVDPSMLVPLEDLFTMAPSDSVDIAIYSSGTYVIFRHPRHARYEISRGWEENHRHRYGLRTHAQPGPRHFVVDVITVASALDSTLAHDGRMWGIVFRVE